MKDHEFRIVFTDDERDVMCVAVYYVGPEDQQIAFLDAWEASPFDTRTEMMVRAMKSVVNALPKRNRVLR